MLENKVHDESAIKKTGKKQQKSRTGRSLVIIFIK